MTTYQVTAWCVVPHYTTFDVHAGNIAEALEKARNQAQEEYGDPCDGVKCDWDEFEVVSDNAGEQIRHLEPARRTENAAQELLDHLRTGVSLVQFLLATWDGGDLAGAVRALAQWHTDAGATIAQATDGQSEEDETRLAAIHLG